MRTQRLVMCAAALALPLVACGSSDSAGSDDSTAAVPAATTTVAVSGSPNEVVVQNYTFPAITASPGATLTLVNRDDEPHTITSDDGWFKADRFTSAEPGHLVVPTKAGSYAIHCEIHPTMHGTLVVSDPSATPASTAIPTPTTAPATADPYGY